MKTWLTLRQASAYCNLSVRTLRYRIKRKTHPLPARRIDGKIMIERWELDRWLRAHPRVKPKRTVQDKVVDDMLRDLLRGDDS